MNFDVDDGGVCGCDGVGDGVGIGVEEIFICNWMGDGCEYCFYNWVKEWRKCVFVN